MHNSGRTVGGNVDTLKRGSLFFVDPLAALEILVTNCGGTTMLGKGPKGHLL